jgi:ATP-binding cassette subfamily B multidrug efflux pump
MADGVSGKAFDLKLLAKILRYVKPYSFIFYGAFVLTLVLSALSTARPILIQYSIDNFILKPNSDMLLNFTIIFVHFWSKLFRAEYYS